MIIDTSVIAKKQKSICEKFYDENLTCPCDNCPLFDFGLYCEDGVDEMVEMIETIYQFKMPQPTMAELENFWSDK